MTTFDRLPRPPFLSRLRSAFRGAWDGFWMGWDARQVSALHVDFVPFETKFDLKISRREAEE